jgi:fumarylacetoacetate (FAA) hydrolase
MKRATGDPSSGAPSTPFRKFGDVVRIETLDRSGRPLFGAIEQEIVKHG